MATPRYRKHYSDRGFWSKAKKLATQAGKSVLEPALTLYYAGLDDKTPAWAKTTIATALGYFIFPIDAIPDPAPVVGYGDDLGVLLAAVAVVAAHIKPGHKGRAKQTVKGWLD